jgi:hypothetical protein
MNLVEKFKRWWAPGEYDDERPLSDGEGYAIAGYHYAEAETGTEESEPGKVPRVRGSGGI